MKDNFIIESLKIFFENEISNKVIFGENEIFVLLKDGTKARITTIDLI